MVTPMRFSYILTLFLFSITFMNFPKVIAQPDVNYLINALNGSSLRSTNSIRDLQDLTKFADEMLSVSSKPFYINQNLELQNGRGELMAASLSPDEIRDKVLASNNFTDEEKAKFESGFNRAGTSFMSKAKFIAKADLPKEWIARLNLPELLHKLEINEFGLPDKSFHEALIALVSGLHPQNRDEYFEKVLLSYQKIGAGIKEEQQAKILEETSELYDFITRLKDAFDVYFSLSEEEVKNLEERIQNIEITEKLNGIKVDDRLFPDDLYKRFKGITRIPGELIGLSGTLTADQVRKEALERFKKKAKEHGIELKDVTKAIFEGRLNPSFGKAVAGKPSERDRYGDYTDFDLIYEGLANIEDITARDISEQDRKYMIDVGDMQPGDSLPPLKKRGSTLVKSYVGVKRAALWNEIFGAMDENLTVNTIINGKNVEVTGLDLRMRIFLKWEIQKLNKRRRSGSSFEDKYGFEPDVNLTYEEVKSALTEKPRLWKEVEEEIRDRIKYECAHGYFSRYWTGQVNPWNDYNDLRQKRYIPWLKKRLLQQGKI